MKKRTILILFAAITILAILALSILAYEEAVSAHGVALTLGSGETGHRGFNVLTQQKNINITNVTKHASATPMTFAFVIQTDGTKIANATFVGNTAKFSPHVNLTNNNTNWRITTDNNGATYTMQYDSGGTLGIDAYLKWVTGSTQSIDTNNYGNVVSVGILIDTTLDADVTPPIVQTINFTSDGNKLCSAYPGPACANTTDRTPTFRILMDENSHQCRFATTDISFDSMANNCTILTANLSHTCTQPTTITPSDQTFYFGCVDKSGNNNTAPLANAHKANLTINNTFPIADNPKIIPNVFYGRNMLNVSLNLSDEDGDNIEANLTLYINNTLIETFNKTTIQGRNVNFSFDGIGNGYGNFSGGDVFNVTITINDGFTTLYNLINITNTTLSDVSIPNVTAPTTGQIVRLSSDGGFLNITWATSTDANDSRTNIRYNVSFSEDSGLTWTNLAQMVGNTFYQWSIGQTPCTNSCKSYQTDYRVRVQAGYGYNSTTIFNQTSDFTIGNISLTTQNIRIRPESGLGFNQSVKVHYELLSGFGTNITRVNVSIFHANGSRFADANGTVSNGSTNGRYAEIQSLVGNGTFTVEVLASNDGSNQTSTNTTFTFEDILQILPAPQEISIVLNPGETYKVNISIEQNTNATVAYTFRAVNFSGFLSAEANHTTFDVIGASNTSDPFKINANITVSGATPDGIYTGGFFQINRTLDMRSSSIKFLVGVNPPRGEITLQRGAAKCDRTIGNCNLIENNLSTDSVKSFTWVLNNTRDFALSNCEAHFVTFNGANTTQQGATISLGSATVQPNQTTSLVFDLVNPPLGDYNYSVEATCAATTFGYTDTLSKDPSEVPEIAYSVIPPPPQGGQSPVTGGAPGLTKPEIAALVANLTTRCGDNICTSGTETFFSCFQDCGTPEQLFKQIKALQIIFALGLISILALILLPKPRNKKQEKPK